MEMERILSTVEHPTFETVWAALQENAAQLREQQRENAEWKAQWEKERAKQQKAEAKWREAEAKRQAEETKRREAREAEETKRQEAREAEEAKRREAREAEEAKRREEEAKRQEAREAEEAKRREELDRQMKKTDRKMKELGKRMGDLHNRFGEIAEHLVAPGIATRFNEMGYHFDEIAPHGVRITDEQGIKTRTEIDLLLQNGELIVAVEIKVKPKVQDIEHHERRLEILRETRSKKNDRRQIRGAIAGAIFGPLEKKAVAEAGLYVIEQSGDTMKIDIPEGFVPREW